MFGVAHHIAHLVQPGLAVQIGGVYNQCIAFPMPDRITLPQAHIPDNVRLWQGDSVGHWEGDTLVVDTTNLNGKTWLNEVGDVVSHAEHVVERFTLVDAGKLIYRATVTDPLAYTRSWTIEIPLSREPDELLEVACHEDNGDLQHLK